MASQDSATQARSTLQGRLREGLCLFQLKLQDTTACPNAVLCSATAGSHHVSLANVLAEHRLTAEEALQHSFLSKGSVPLELEECRQLAAWTASAQAAGKHRRPRA